jgi:hypothetical protein
VRHGNGSFLVQACQQLGFPVTGVAENRLVQARERGARIDGGVIEVELAEHVDHEVGRRLPDGLDTRRRGAGFSLCLGLGREQHARSRRLRRGFRFDRCAGDDKRRGPERCSLEEFPASHGVVAGAGG